MQKIKDNLGLIIVSTSTIIYLFLLLYIVFDLAEFSSLKLNEKGDVLAGVFAPLAFLWLIYGYYQQGQELKQNTDALKLQADELANNVEQQRNIYNTARKELDLTVKQMNLNNKQLLIQAQPYFHINNLYVFLTEENDAQKSCKIEIKFKLNNSRSLCRGLFFMLSLDAAEPDYMLEGSMFQIFESDINKIHDVFLSTSLSKLSTPSSVYLKFYYTDVYDDFQFQTITIDLLEGVFSDPKEVIHQWSFKSFVTTNTQPH